MNQYAAPTDGADSFDRIALDLQHLRESAGPVSYSELVRRITRIRLDRGMNASAAIPARSTVYHAFQTGRVRIDTGLLRDIVVALGVGPEETNEWVQRCTDAHGATAARAPRQHEAQKPALPAPQPHPPAGQPLGFVAMVFIGGVVLNLLGLLIANTFKLTVYLDMVGTAISSIILGPWHGVAVAFASNGLGFLTGDLNTLEFTPVNIVGALVWGYGVRRFGMGRTMSRFISLNLLAALACSLVALPLILRFFFGGDGHASNQAVLQLEAMDLPFAVAVFSTNIITSVTDKLLTGFIALAVFTALHNKLNIPSHQMPLVEKLGSLRVAHPARA